MKRTLGGNVKFEITGFRRNILVGCPDCGNVTFQGNILLVDFGELCREPEIFCERIECCGKKRIFPVLCYKLDTAEHNRRLANSLKDGNCIRDLVILPAKKYNLDIYELIISVMASNDSVFEG